MSDVTQPEFDGTAPVTSRLSRRTLRERAAQLDAEKTAEHAAVVEPVVVEVAEVVIAPEVVVAQADVGEVPPVVPLPQSVGVSQVSTVAEPPAPVSRVTPVVPITELDTAPTAAAPVSRVVRRSTTQMAPRLTQPPTPAVINTPPATPFAPVSSIVTDPANLTNSDLLPGAPPLPAGVPPWDAITSGSGPDGEIATLDTGATRAERHALRSDEVARVAPPSAGYTWLQYLILIAVAFVLGLLLWQLIIGELPIPHLGGGPASIGAGLVGFMESLL